MSWDLLNVMLSGSREPVPSKGISPWRGFCHSEGSSKSLWHTADNSSNTTPDGSQGKGTAHSVMSLCWFYHSCCSHIHKYRDVPGQWSLQTCLCTAWRTKGTGCLVLTMSYFPLDWWRRTSFGPVCKHVRWTLFLIFISITHFTWSSCGILFTLNLEQCCIF